MTRAALFYYSRCADEIVLKLTDDGLSSSDNENEQNKYQYFSFTETYISLMKLVL